MMACVTAGDRTRQAVQTVTITPVVGPLDGGMSERPTEPILPGT
jgi:hypothetical protein